MKVFKPPNTNISGVNMSESNQTQKQIIKKYAKTADELIFNTDTDDSNYPIYILSNSELIHKKHPEDQEIAAAFNVSVSRIVDSNIENSIINSCQIYSKALEALKDITGYKPHQDVYEISYEGYRGDFEEFVGNAKAYAIKLIVPSVYSLVDEKRSFAVVYNWLKRLSAKYPEISKYAYVGRYGHGKRLKYHFAALIVKLPVITSEIDALFKNATSPPQEADADTQVQDVEEEPKVPDTAVTEVLKPKELELELAPETAPSQAPQPPQPEEKPERRELVRIYLLSMKLPSKYLVQKVTYEKRKEVREFNDLAPKLETIRREAYRMVSRVFAYVEEYGTWIAVTEDAVREAHEVSKYVIGKLTELGLSDKTSRYVVKAVPIYLEPENAKELLNAAIEHLSNDVDELNRRIAEAEAEKKKKALSTLKKDLEYKQRLLEAFKNFLAQIK